MCTDLEPELQDLQRPPTPPDLQRPPTPPDLQDPQIQTYRIHKSRPIGSPDPDLQDGVPLPEQIRVQTFSSEASLPVAAPLFIPSSSSSPCSPPACGQCSACVCGESAPPAGAAAAVQFAADAAAAAVELPLSVHLPALLAAGGRGGRGGAGRRPVETLMDHMNHFKHHMS
ncbi:formin-like protein 13 [Myripristis murdjan]|uniref:formin-like protein 13 n=1 Tax=Myripristis murdjan TaxID=586833 RepID=UPI001176433B|nr:formin-like protein 13 [Myripristis murdjan]